MLVDAMETEEEDLKDGDEDEDKDQFEADAAFSHRKKRTYKQTDELLLVSTAMVMLVGGYDTTMQTMSYLG